jgi:PBSX family phage terminase large subunit
MILSPKQKKVIRLSNARLNILEGSVRSSKTVAFLWRWIKYVGGAPPGDLLMIGKSMGSLYRNLVRPLQDLLGNQMDYFPGKHEIDLWGRKIFCFGAYDEGSEGTLRGMTAAGALGDELTLWPKSFFMTLLARLSVKGAQFFGTTNPDSPYHYIKTDFLDREDLNLYQEHFVIDDNPFLDPQYVEDLKKEYVGLWYKRFIEGLWVQAEGAVYDFFDEATHTKDLFALPRAQSHGVAVDYGTDNPTCFLLFGERQSDIITTPKMPRCWCMKEYYYDSKKTSRQKTDEEYADDFVDFIKGVEPGNIYIDPSALSFITALKRRGIANIRDTDNSVIDGIRTQASMLKNGDYVVCRGCRQTIQDYGAYCWDARAQKNGEDKPLKQNDHTKDPERYYLYNRYGVKKLNYERLTRW